MEVDQMPLNFSTSFFTTTEAVATTANVTASASLNSSRWQLSESIEGPVLATLVGVEFILSLLSNLFILAHTLYHSRESFKKSSTIFLFSLALSNLLTSLLYMFFVIISTSAEEWIFGPTDIVRNILCQLHGFIFAYFTTISIHTLSVISFDRFLSIVKPNFHQRFFTWKVALGIMMFIWVCVCT